MSFLDYKEANFLQSPEYGRMNELLGCKVFYDDFGGCSSQFSSHKLELEAERYCYPAFGRMESEVR